jgi:hypothetical protein
MGYNGRNDEIRDCGKWRGGGFVCTAQKPHVDI